MNLQNIETLVLQLIKFDKYSDLSADATKIADFAVLHQCVNLAREDFKINCSAPELLTIGATIPTIVNMAGYSLAADFDIPVAFYYATSASTNGNRLTKTTAEQLAASIALSTVGTPTTYCILGTSGNLIQVYLLPIPDVVGFLFPLYKPVLTALSLAADEDIILRKYPKIIINFATAYAAQMLKSDQVMYDKYYAIALSECRKIDLRQISGDTVPDLTVDTFLQTKRQDRLTI
ncbi:MAG: hypothetical protein V1709_10310 [Planctomycetota bacterium]